MPGCCLETLESFGDRLVGSWNTSLALLLVQPPSAGGLYCRKVMLSGSSPTLVLSSRHLFLSQYTCCCCCCCVTELVRQSVKTSCRKLHVHTCVLSPETNERQPPHVGISHLQQRRGSLNRHWPCPKSHPSIRTFQV